MTIEPVASGVWAIALGFVNAFVVEGDGVTLVDAGAPMHLEQIRAAVAERGTLRAIAATHYHVDHIGTVPDMAGPDVTTYVHRNDAPGMRGDVPIPEPTFEGEAKERFDAFRESQGLLTPVRARVDVLLEDGDVVPTTGLRAIHTPGHTTGHLCYLYEPSRVLFVGDAAANVGTLSAPIAEMSEDLDAALASVRRIAEFDFDIAVFGHGDVISGRANVEFRSLIESLAS